MVQKMICKGCHRVCGFWALQWVGLCEEFAGSCYKLLWNFTGMCKGAFTGVSYRTFNSATCTSPGVHLGFRDLGCRGKLLIPARPYDTTVIPAV